MLCNTLEYSEEAQDEGIQGSIILRFLVDIDGTVNNVAVVSGPKELRKETERAIKKSGKWIPSEQIGKKVKTYRIQMITFRLKE
ncbi:energy transducer TonB [Bacteroidetes bacterium endosymbiont of Geopemphigus sp.]|uniref:energy transducer TonB n=1 Tax=Bacteroidetes bacterium endosymbiont of Geopemphigus sp. TaxID=2047937 RepID=UPI003977622F